MPPTRLERQLRTEAQLNGILTATVVGFLAFIVLVFLWHTSQTRRNRPVTATNIITPQSRCRGEEGCVLLETQKDAARAVMPLIPKRGTIDVSVGSTSFHDDMAQPVIQLQARTPQLCVRLRI